MNEIPDFSALKRWNDFRLKLENISEEHCQLDFDLQAFEEFRSIVPIRNSVSHSIKEASPGPKFFLQTNQTAPVAAASQQKIRCCRAQTSLFSSSPEQGQDQPRNVSLDSPNRKTS